VLATARCRCVHDVAIVDRDQVQEAVAVEVHRLELVVVGVGGEASRVLGERSRAVVAEQAPASTALAGDDDVEVGVVVGVDELETPGQDPTAVDDDVA